MAIIEGDIDLTQNLDFYRKKPKKLLPDNVKLRGRKDVEENNISLCTSSGSSIQIYLNNNTNVTWTIRRNNENFQYIDIEDDVYIDTDNIVSENSSSSSLYTTTTNYSNNITYSATYTTRFNYINTTSNIEDNSWTSIRGELNKKFGTLIESVENKFKLWLGRPKFEEKESLHLIHCYSCGEKFLSFSKTNNCCKKCSREKRINESMNRIVSRKGYRLILNHINRSQDYDMFDDIPWDNKPKNKRWISKYVNKFSSRNNEDYRYGIPWFQDLNSRIYEDYIEELKNGEKDYSSYLTNMGWIGIRRETVTEGIEINNDDSFFNEINPEDLTLINSDEELEQMSIQSSRNRRNYIHDDSIDSIISSFSAEWININNNTEYYV